MKPPAPVAPIGAPVVAPEPDDGERFFAPATLRPAFAPTTTTEPPRRQPKRRGSLAWLTVVGVVVFVLAAATTIWFDLSPGGGSHGPPTPLAPQAATNALPTSLSAIVRIQAESTRHNAIQAVEYVESGDLTKLATAQPSYQWVAGTAPSTGPQNVSVSEDASGLVTLAVAGSNHDICAFGRWSQAAAAPLYVTMEHEPNCAAVDAPAANWSTEPGGAASDLPDDNG